MPKKYNNRYEYMTEKKVDWLNSFADAQGEKIAKQNNLLPNEIKSAGHMESILDIVERKKKISVQSKVEAYRLAVGLDLVDSLEKESAVEIKTASRISLSIRDKFAQDDSQLMANITQYINQVIKNRNGAIASPAILEQIENYMKIDKEWLREHYEKIEEAISNARKEFSPEKYNAFPVNELAKNDEYSEKEAPLFVPPAKT